MSTGAPPFADLTPQSNGHTHSHSRSRGHTRSARCAQPPPPLSLGGSYAFQSNSLESTNVVSGDQSQNYAPQAKETWPDHQHELTSSVLHPIAQLNHSHTSHHHDHDHDHDHDHVINHDHIIEPIQAGKAGYDSNQMHELLSGALIALPWIVLSWYPRKCAQRCELNGSSKASTALSGQIGQKTCVLTSTTLLMFACGQYLRIKHQRGSSIDAPSIKLPMPSIKIAQAAFMQATSIALPIYASLKIGGFLVAFALLLATATGVPNLMANNLPNENTERYNRKILTSSLLAIVTVLSSLGFNQSWDASPVTGYMALLLSVFVLSPPFPVLRRLGPIPEPGLVAPSQKRKTLGGNQSLVLMTTDVSLALVSGASLAILAIVIVGGIPLTIFDWLFHLLPAGLFAVALMVSLPAELRSTNRFGLALCTGGAALFCSPHIRDDFTVIYPARIILAVASFFASKLDDRHLRTEAHSHSHSHHHHSNSHATVESSGATKWLLQRTESYPLLYSILKEKDSRSIFYFMCLNFAFMLVQLSYGFLTGSLGLLSDSIHMFFDCLALVVGLCAAVMSRWPPSARFPYGYGKVDTLSGFANGIFLMIISVEIIYEAVERLSSGSQMNRIGELLAVSFAGLLVNLVGIFSFEHGHHHHGHDHGHDHTHGNENMHGIFLHILADTLGSVAVVISTILVHYTGWAGYDPLASCFIAILIFASAVPLVSSTAKTLLLTLPADTEYTVRETLAGVSMLRGVVGYTVPKFWLDDTGSTSEHQHGHAHDHPSLGSCNHSHDHGHNHHEHDHDHHHHHHHDHDHDHAHEHKRQNVFGVIHVIASRGSDLEDVRQRTISYLRDKDMDIVVQVERDGDGHCWCGGGHKGP